MICRVTDNPNLVFQVAIPYSPRLCGFCWESSHICALCSVLRDRLGSSPYHVFAPQLPKLRFSIDVPWFPLFQLNNSQKLQFCVAAPQLPLFQLNVVASQPPKRIRKVCVAAPQCLLFQLNVVESQLPKLRILCCRTSIIPTQCRRITTPNTYNSVLPHHSVYYLSSMPSHHNPQNLQFCVAAPQCLLFQINVVAPLLPHVATPQFPKTREFSPCRIYGKYI